MSIPSAVFLDTSVYAGQQYNFESAAFQSFIPVCAKHNLKVLLPDPTQREVRRQIKSRSAEALAALEGARKKAPFIEKWKHFPAKSATNFAAWEVARVANTQWREFLKNFDVVELGYQGINLVEIMNWYDSSIAPFKEGKKRKEFPDAFAIQIVHAYAQKEGVQVAVVSADTDLKEACERYPHLLYFKTIPRLTELVLASETELGVLKNAIEDDLDVIDQAALDNSEKLSFYPEEDEYEVLEDHVDLIAVYDKSIVAIGDGECTITFEAEVHSRHLFKWMEAGWEDYPEVHEDWVTNTSLVRGTAKISIDMTKSEVTGVTSLEFDDTWVDISASDLM